MSQKLNPAVTLGQAARQRALDHIQNTGKFLAASIVSAKNSIVTVSFQQGGGYQLPNATIPAFGPQYTRHPYQKGDMGFVLAPDMILSAMSGLGPSTAPGLSRPGNLSTLVFMPIGNANWTPTDDPNAKVSYGPTGTVSRDTNKKSKHIVHPTNGVTSQTGVTQGSPPTNPTYNMTDQLHPQNGWLAQILDTTNGTHMASLVPQGGSGILGWVASVFGGQHSHTITSIGHDIKSSSEVKLDAPNTTATGNMSVQQALSALSAAFSSMSGGGGFGVSSGGALTAPSAAINGPLSATGPIAGPIIQLTPGLTVAELLANYPAASYPGAIAYVTDSPTIVFNAILTVGLGTDAMLTHSNGVNWVIG
jgi:hypothetical protein